MAMAKELDTCPACQMDGHSWSDPDNHPEVWSAERVRLLRFERTKHGSFTVSEVWTGQSRSVGFFRRKAAMMSVPEKAKVHIDRIVDLSRGSGYIAPEDFIPEDMEMRFETERPVHVVEDVNNLILIIGEPEKK